MKYTPVLLLNGSVDIIKVGCYPEDAAAVLTSSLKTLYTLSYLCDRYLRGVPTGVRVYTYPGNSMKFIDVSKGEYVLPGYSYISKPLHLDRYNCRKRIPGTTWDPITGMIINPTMTNSISRTYVTLRNYNDTNGNALRNPHDIVGWKVRIVDDTIDNSYVDTRRLRKRADSTLINDSTCLDVYIVQLIQKHLLPGNGEIRLRIRNCTSIYLNEIEVIPDEDDVFTCTVPTDSDIVLKVPIPHSRYIGEIEEL